MGAAPLFRTAHLRRLQSAVIPPCRMVPVGPNHRRVAIVGAPFFRTVHLLRLQSVTPRRRMVPVGPNHLTRVAITSYR